MDKPPYRVPTMAEIAAVPWNGFTAISTFSGAGGSSLGYRMAGFKVAWASEFIEAARNTYRANSPGTIVDDRDMRDVTPQEVLDTLGMRPGELHLMDGSPPCSSFSLAGKREKGWGKVANYSQTTQRVDDLFFEFARLVKGIRPCVFVAENVPGLVIGTAKGYFREIMRALKRCGYKVQARLLDAQWLGVPQARQRIIFIGVRDDLPAEPAHPAPLPYRYTIRDAVAGLPERVSVDPETQADLSLEGYAYGREWHQLRRGQNSTKYFQLERMHPDRPAPTITTNSTRGGHGAAPCHWGQPRALSLQELRRIASFPDDFILTGSFEQRWERIGRAVPPVMMSHIAATIRDKILNPLREQGRIQ